MGVQKSLQTSRQTGVRGGGSTANNGFGISGDAELMKIMKGMRRTSHRRVNTAGAFNAGKALKKIVKAAIPSRMKDARKAVGCRRLKAKEAPDGGAKIGAGVGRTTKKRMKELNKIRDGKKGVGIGPNNIHWIIEGTDERETGKKGGPKRDTGAMPPETPPVHVLAVRNRGILSSLFAFGARKQLVKEIKKRKAF